MLGLTPSYVATLRQRALREGTAALVRAAGRPRETGEASWEQARAWRARGVRDAEIARRLGVNQSTVLRRLGRAHVQDPLPPEPRPEPDTDEPQRTAPDPREQTGADPQPPAVRPDRLRHRGRTGFGPAEPGPGRADDTVAVRGGDVAARVRRAGRGGGRTRRRGRGRRGRAT